MVATPRRFNPIQVKPSASKSFLRHLYQQGKQVSQIVAYIWRWADEIAQEYEEQNKIANQLKTYFEKPTYDPKDVGDNLKRLFRANPNNPNDQSKEANLLRAVFFNKGLDNKDYIFPIFDEFELGDENSQFGYLFEITVNAFTGSIEDANINTDLLKMVIPYPPRPAFSNATLDQTTLEDWIENREKTQYFAGNHYIPTSSC